MSQVHDAMDPARQVATVHGRGGLVMFWVAFCWQFCGCLVLVPSSLNTIRYVQLLSDHCHPFMSSCYEMEYSSEKIALLVGPRWVLSGWMSIPLTSLS